MTWYLQQALIISAVVVLAYLIGNINFAIIISRIKGRDIRTFDSGNPGTMNMIRNFGKPIGAITLTCEALKGATPALIGWLVVGGIGFGDHYMRGIVLFVADTPRLGAYIAGLAVMIGHVFPVFYKFKGGKGIATAIGVGVIAQPVLAVLAFFTGFAFLAITQLGAITSFLIISTPLAVEAYLISLGVRNGALYAGYATPALVLLFVLFMFTVFTHRTNIIKLFDGTERKTRLVKTKAEREAKRAKKLAEQQSQEQNVNS